MINQSTSLYQSWFTDVGSIVAWGGIMFFMFSESLLTTGGEEVQNKVIKLSVVILVLVFSSPMSAIHSNLWLLL